MAFQRETAGNTECYFSFQRSVDEDQTLIQDLEELLELKKEINRMREASEAPGLDSRSKYLHLQDLQSLLERLKTLKEQVEANNGAVSQAGKATDTYYSESPDVVHFCDLQLVETVPDVLEEKDLSHQLTSKSIFEVRKSQCLNIGKLLFESLAWKQQCENLIGNFFCPFFTRLG